MYKIAMTACAALLAAACAPDQFSNVKATGLNGFIDTAAVACAPLQAGPMVITPNYQPPNYATGQYGVWLDQTSNLYYKRIPPEVYIENIGNLFGDRSVPAAKCLVSKLPPPGERPYAPPR